LSAGPVGQFIGGYLSRLDRSEPGNEFFVVDSAYRLVGSADGAAPVGERLGNRGLRSALSGHGQGVYRNAGSERFFTSAPVGGSSWRVLVSTPTKSFYAALSGSGRWLVWMLFAAFALAVAASAYVLRQALGRKSQLAESNRELATMNSTLEQQVAERTAALEERAEQLARSNAELEQFGYVASHDLQEPLRKIQAFGDRLEAKNGARLDAEGQDYLRRMQEAAARSRSMINDLLAFSRLTSQPGSFALTDLTAIAKDAVSDLQVQIEEAGGRVEVGELPSIEAEPDQMRRLLQNLIANALKFRRDETPPKVRVDGSLVNRGVTVCCELTVADNGIGFDEQYLDRIFSIFQRLHSRSEYDGTGIGLAVCKKIVQHHAGSITAQSKPGEGSTFVIILPARQREEDASL
jgi:signal transduction histidine kinase